MILSFAIFASQNATNALLPYSYERCLKNIKNVLSNNVLISIQEKERAFSGINVTPYPYTTT